MKKYFFFALRVNIAVFLAIILVAQVLPIVIVPIVLMLPKNLLMENLPTAELIASVIGLITGYLIQYFVYKSTYLNSKRVDKALELNQCVLYSVGLSFLVYVILFLITSKGIDPVAIGTNLAGLLFSAIAYYLAGKNIEKKISDPNFFINEKKKLEDEENRGVVL